MKRFLRISAVTLCAVLLGITFSACKKDTITGTYLEYPRDNEEISFTQTTVSSDGKNAEYELTATYGVQVKVEDFTFYKTINHSENLKLDKKTGDSDGYTLESTLPSSAPDAGEYKLTYTYSDWVNTVNIKIEKKKIALPALEQGNEVEYDGKDYTPRIIYDRNTVTMLNALEERKYPKDTPSADYSRYYNVEFELKDKTNYCWEDGQFGSDNYTYSFNIIKKQLRLDLTKYCKVDTTDEHYEEGYDMPMFRYALRENYPKNIDEVLALSSVTVDESELSGFADLVELKIVKNPYNPYDQIEVGEMNQAGTYYIILKVKDERCYEVGTTTQTTGLLSWIGLCGIFLA